ncbi:MAG: amidohydrolase [Clostridia bacterium]|nr:amidohydrolase [Clostridia bacterium]
MKYNYIDIRRQLHENPELSWAEFDTSKKISSILNDLSIKTYTNIAKTGVVGILNNNSSDKCIVVRADMDALPLYEKNNVSYKSKNDGVMHACGHDVHVATVLMAADLLSSQKEKINGTVKFVFQPAEETTGGALPMIDEGVLENPKASACVGFHVRPELETGKIISSSGKIMASPDSFSIELSGKGGHCATPEQNDNLILALSKLINEISLISYPDSVVSVCTVNAGTVYNIMPSSVSLSGSFRTFEEESRNKIAEDIKKCAKKVAQEFKIKEDTLIEFLYPPLKNDKKLTEILQKSASNLLGENNVITEFNPSYLGEDFAYFGQYLPSTYFFLGAKMENRITSLHSDDFDVDERCIEIGAKCIAQFVIDYLNNEN